MARGSYKPTHAQTLMCKHAYPSHALWDPTLSIDGEIFSYGDVFITLRLTSVQTNTTEREQIGTGPDRFRRVEGTPI